LFAAKRAGRNRIIGPPADHDLQATLPLDDRARVSNS
jgi:hypothetical protein